MGECRRHPTYRFRDDPLLQAVIGPCVEHAENALDAATPSGLLAQSCKEGLLLGFEKLLIYMAGDTIEALVSERLAQVSPLLAADIRLAPRTEVMGTRRTIAESIRMDPSVLDEKAPLLREQLARQAERFMRDTNLYARYLMRLWKADAYDPSTRRSLLQRFTRGAVQGEGWLQSALADAEATSLAQGDIPFSTVPWWGACARMRSSEAL